MGAVRVPPEIRFCVRHTHVKNTFFLPLIWLVVLKLVNFEPGPSRAVLQSFKIRLDTTEICSDLNAIVVTHISSYC